MRTITTFSDLEKFGIVPLTGESCGISRRMLCDVTEQGRQLVTRTFGLPNNTKLSEPWNSSSSSGEHVGSIMLSRNQITDLGVFALLPDYSHVLVTDTGMVYGTDMEFRQIENDDVWIWQYRRDSDEWLDWPSNFYGKIVNRYVGHSALRNTHSMTGRTN